MLILMGLIYVKILIDLYISVLAGNGIRIDTPSDTILPHTYK